MLKPQRATVVLLHGGHPGAAQACRTLDGASLAIDLPRRQTLEASMKSALAQMPQSGPLVLVGHALTAPVALALSAQLGGRLEHLVLIAGPVPEPGQSTITVMPWFARLMGRLGSRRQRFARSAVHWQRPLPCPVTYVQCLHDRGPLTPRRQLKLAARLGASVQLVPVETGHHAMLDQPTGLVNIIGACARNQG